MNKDSPVTAAFPTLAAAHFLDDTDISVEELKALLELAAAVKRTPADYRQSLVGRSIALLFEKPSLRTRMTFELAALELGAGAVFQDHRGERIGEREPARDIARNLDRWFDAIVARTFSHETLEELARWSSAPVVNALSGSSHPCQALADCQTILERFGTFEGLKIAYVGDGNNVAHSLLLCAARLGVSFVFSGPKGYEPRPATMRRAAQFAAVSGAAVEIEPDAKAAARGAAVVYTDTWTSMGWEQETQQRRIAFADYQVTETLLAAARPDAVFMHCLPALRGEEVSDAVIESEQSAVFDQAENRLHAQKALLLMLLGGK